MTSIGFSLELKSGAVTALADLPALTACRHGNAVYFSDGNRLCRVGGHDDDGTPIAARLTLPATDCGRPGPKRLLAVVLEGRLDGETMASAASDEGSLISGAAAPAGSDAAAGRTPAKLGRGRGNQWQVRLETSATGAWDCGAITLFALPLDRRLA